ncbi:MAG: helix-turn-helix transcriptional regulator [Acidimicrobiales bacterium]
MDRYGMFKALGESTRYRIYLDLSRAPASRSTAELAERLGLHPNTLRPHLDQLREVGLVDRTVGGRGTVGRPHHRWSVGAAPPSTAAEPVGLRLLAHLLADVAARGGLGPDELRAVGRAQGSDRLRPAGDGPTRLRGMVDQLANLGFDPVVERAPAGAGDDLTTVSFCSCPFRELAVAFPDVVCQLHRGLTEGLLGPEPAGGAGGPSPVELRTFATLVDEDPCRVELAVH